MSEVINNSVDVQRENHKVLSWLAAILLFLLMKPYFIWPAAEYFHWFLTLPLCLIMFAMRSGSSSSTSSAVFWGIIMLMSGFFVGNNIVGIFFLVILASLFLPGEEFLNNTYRKLWKVYWITLIPSILVFLMVMAGIDLPHVVIPPLNGLKSYSYTAYPFLVMDNAYGDFTRFFGMYDEPGVIGTFAILFLVAEKGNLKKLGNIVILISGLLSFSLFFYIAFALYSVYLLIFGYNSKMNKIILVLFIGAAAFYITSNVLSTDYLKGRLEWDSDKQSLTGDTRANSQLKYEVDKIRWTNEYFFGSRDERVREAAQGSASIQNLIVSFGLIVIILFFLCYLHHFKRLSTRNRDALMYLIFLLSVIYNRPFITDPVFIVLMNLCGYSFVSESLKKLNNNK